MIDLIIGLSTLDCIRCRNIHVQNPYNYLMTCLSVTIKVTVYVKNMVPGCHTNRDHLGFGFGMEI